MTAEPVYRTTITLGKLLFRALDLRVRSAGAENVPSTGPVILACNHVSFPDFLFVGDALLGQPRLVRFLCRHDIWNSPAGPAMSAMRHVPVDREAPAAAYLQARSLLRAGEVVCAFPEAGISAAYVVRAMMPGAAALARETGAALVPVTVWGGQRLWGQKRDLESPLPRPTIQRGRTVDVRFGEPRTVAADADLVEVTRSLGEHFQTELEQLQRLPEHQPRPGEWAPWHPRHLGGDAVERTASFALDGMPRAAVAPTWGPGVAPGSS
ncbi:MAG: lysophospholipid acyltransferase family protein [Nocardioides sp.]